MKKPSEPTAANRPNVSAEERFGHRFGEIRSTNLSRKRQSPKDVVPIPGPDYKDAIIASRLRAARVATVEAIFNIADISRLPEEERAKKWNAQYFKCWFGPYSNRSLRRIEKGFDGIGGSLLSDGLEVERSAPNCRPDDYAYSFPFDTVIYLCPLWWVADEEEQAQTFIHEASHLAGILPRSRGEVYERQPALDLAFTRPSAALRNSDNYGYFAIDSTDSRMNQKCSKGPWERLLERNRNRWSNQLWAD